MKKKLNYLMCLAFAGLAFTACEKDDNNYVENSLATDGKIYISVENGANYSSKIDSVYLELLYEEDGIWYDDVIAKVSYGNGNFTVALPLNLPSKYLRNFNLPAGVTVSDSTAKMVSFDNFLAIKDEYVAGYIYGSNISWGNIINREVELEKASTDGICEVVYIYVDKPVTIKGTVEWESENYYNIENYNYVVKDNYNVSLLKGWNATFNKQMLTVINRKITGGTVEYFNSQKPAGLKWYAKVYDNSIENTISAKSVKSAFADRHNLFSKKH